YIRIRSVHTHIASRVAPARSGKDSRDDAPDGVDDRATVGLGEGRLPWLACGSERERNTEERGGAHGVLPRCSAPHGCVVARATCFFGIQDAGSCARVSCDTYLIAGSSRKRCVSSRRSPSSEDFCSVARSSALNPCAGVTCAARMSSLWASAVA